MIRVLALALASAALAAAGDLSGNWNLTASAPDGEDHKAVLELKEDAGKVTGTISGPEGSIPLEDVQWKGDQISWRLAAHDGVVLKLTVAGDTMKGTYTLSDGSGGPVAATRAGAVSVAGKWKGTAKSTAGKVYNVLLELASQDGKISGTLATDEGSLAVEDVHLEAGLLAFKLHTGDAEYNVRLVVAGERMNGTFKGTNESGTVEVSR